MGADKALLRLPDGRSLVVSVAMAAAAVCDPVVVLGGTPDHGQMLETLALPTGVRVYADAAQMAGAGPLPAIATGLRLLGGLPALVLSCDLPFLGAAHLRALLRAASSTADLVVPRAYGYPQPLCALYRPGVLSVAEQLVAQGARAPRQLLTHPRLTIQMIAADYIDPTHRLFVACNTPADAAHAGLLVPHAS